MQAQTIYKLGLQKSHQKRLPWACHPSRSLNSRMKSSKQLTRCTSQKQHGALLHGRKLMRAKVRAAVGERGTVMHARQVYAPARAQASADTPPCCRTERAHPFHQSPITARKTSAADSCVCAEMYASLIAWCGLSLALAASTGVWKGAFECSNSQCSCTSRGQPLAQDFHLLLKLARMQE